MFVRQALIFLAPFAAACASAPRAGPLPGTPGARRLPDTVLRPGHWRLVFTWDYRERVFSSRGEGVARIAPPDSVRLDFFLDHGASGGYVIVIDDSVRLPPGSQAGRYMPPAPLLWAALGRVAVSESDTVVHIDGDTLRADIGRPPGPVWRLAFGREELVRMERISNGRIEETVERSDSVRVLYRQPGSGRTLRLTVTRRLRETAFDETIWRP